MANQFKNRYLCKYFKDGTDEKLDIWHLGTIGMANCRSDFYKNEVLNEWKEYERVKLRFNIRENGVVIDGNCGYLIVECSGMEDASRLFWEKFGQI